MSYFEEACNTIDLNLRTFGDTWEEQRLMTAGAILEHWFEEPDYRKELYLKWLEGEHGSGGEISEDLNDLLWRIAAYLRGS